MPVELVWVRPEAGGEEDAPRPPPSELEAVARHLAARLAARMRATPRLAAMVRDAPPALGLVRALLLALDDEALDAAARRAAGRRRASRARPSPPCHRSRGGRCR
jgi:hypothetical protein